jgi:hypothetical protein
MKKLLSSIAFFFLPAICFAQAQNFPGGANSPPNSPLAYATSGPGPVFNVANYAGAFHDTKSNTFCDTSISATQVTCSIINGVNPFCNGGSVVCQAGQTTDVGKRIQCSDGVDGLDWTTGSTITSVISSTVASVSGARTFAGSGQKCTYGHPDDVALVSSFTAALAQSTSFSGQGVANSGQNTAAQTLYLPAGGWMVCNPSGGLPIFSFGANKKGFTIAGDGYDVTFLYNCDTAPSMTGFGYWINNANMTNLYIHDFTIWFWFRYLFSTEHRYQQCSLTRDKRRRRSAISGWRICNQLHC